MRRDTSRSPNCRWRCNRLAPRDRCCKREVDSRQPETGLFRDMIGGQWPLGARGEHALSRLKAFVGVACRASIPGPRIPGRADGTCRWTEEEPACVGNNNSTLSNSSANAFDVPRSALVHVLHSNGCRTSKKAGQANVAQQPAPHLRRKWLSNC